MPCFISCCSYLSISKTFFSLLICYILLGLSIATLGILFRAYKSSLNMIKSTGPNLPFPTFTFGSLYIISLNFGVSLFFSGVFKITSFSAFVLLFLRFKCKFMGYCFIGDGVTEGNGLGTFLAAACEEMAWAFISFLVLKSGLFSNNFFKLLLFSK